jgi:hypothetical protein
MTDKTSETAAPPADLESYMEAARKEAKRRWGYPDMVDEDPEVFKKAFEAGEDIEELVQNFGEELDLMDPGPWHPGR